MIELYAGKSIKFFPSLLVLPQIFLLLLCFPSKPTATEALGSLLACLAHMSLPNINILVFFHLGVYF